MIHEVHIVHRFGGDTLQHRVYKGVTDLAHVLDGDFTPRTDTGTLENASWILAEFDPTDPGGLMVDGAAEGEAGFFDLDDLKEGIHYRVRLQAMLQA